MCVQRVITRHTCSDSMTDGVIFRFQNGSASRSYTKTVRSDNSSRRDAFTQSVYNIVQCFGGRARHLSSSRAYNGDVKNNVNNFRKTSIHGQRL